MSSIGRSNCSRYCSKDDRSSIACSSEPTSCYFVANFGNLDSAIVDRLEKWAGECCADHTLHRHDDDSVMLYAAKTGAKTARQYQSLLRTLSSHWKMSFGKLDRGWLTLLTDAQYKEAVAQTNSAKTSPSMPLPLYAETQPSPQKVHAGAPKVVLLSYSTGLGDDFARRSHQALAELRAAAARQACA